MDTDQDKPSDPWSYEDDLSDGWGILSGPVKVIEAVGVVVGAVLFLLVLIVIVMVGSRIMRLGF
jgi:hypothetical protein